MRARVRSDAGFTLVELIVTMLILTIIGGVLAEVIFAGLRTTDATTSRLGESTDAQLVSTYLIADLQSVDPGGVSTSPAASGCGAGGSNVLQLSWTDAAAGGSYVAAYRITPADAALTLTRYLCKVSPPTTLAATAVAHELSADPAQAPQVTVNDRRVTIRLTEATGFAYTVAGERRTPGASGSTTSTSSTSTSSTSSTTTTTIPGPCSASSAAFAPPAVIGNSHSGHLDSDVTMTVQVSASCEALRIRYDPDGASPTTVSQNPTSTPLTRKFTISGNVHWVTGQHSVQVLRADNSVLTTYQLGVS